MSRKAIAIVAIAFAAFVSAASAVPAKAYQPSDILENPMNSIERLVCRVWPNEIRWCQEEPDYEVEIASLTEERDSLAGMVMELEAKSCPSRAVGMEITTPISATEGDNLVFFRSEGVAGQHRIEIDYGDGWETVSEGFNVGSGYATVTMEHGTARIRLVSDSGKYTVSSESEEFEIR